METRLLTPAAQSSLDSFAGSGEIPDSVKLSFVSGECICDNSSVFSHHRCVSLSDNENTGFKARELKSGHVDAIGTYLKITFHENHVNHYNKYNQVSCFYFLQLLLWNFEMCLSELAEQVLI